MVDKIMAFIANIGDFDETALFRTVKKEVGLVIW